MIEKIKGALFGLAVGDALGVPVEFSSREDLKLSPVSGMRGYGTWNQPPGTWSDDSSLAFCLAEGLTNGYDLKIIAANFISWRMKGYWGALHKVFDVGNSTHAAIERLIKSVSPELAGGMMEEDNGNGSLMRILPLVFITKDLPIEERFRRVKEVSSITHAHFRSVFACFIYTELAKEILNGASIERSLATTSQIVKEFAKKNEFILKEVNLFTRILDGTIGQQDNRKKILSIQAAMSYIHSKHRYGVYLIQMTMPMLY
jgi:ADP-ribosyl-[dinitrogen reductase] hydrolase